MKTLRLIPMGICNLNVANWKDHFHFKGSPCVAVACDIPPVNTSKTIWFRKVFLKNGLELERLPGVWSQFFSCFIFVSVKFFMCVFLNFSWISSFSVWGHIPFRHSTFIHALIKIELFLEGRRGTGASAGQYVCLARLAYLGAQGSSNTIKKTVKFCPGSMLLFFSTIGGSKCSYFVLNCNIFFVV